MLDLDFASNPSCAYDPSWACPLAQPGNVADVDIPVGERAYAPYVTGLPNGGND